MTSKLEQAYQQWPKHRGHNIGESCGLVVCATCGYVTLKRIGEPAPGGPKQAPFFQNGASS